jgi:hypothetical protein
MYKRFMKKMLRQTLEQQNPQILHPEQAGSRFVRTLGSNYRCQRLKTTIFTSKGLLIF